MAVDAAELARRARDLIVDDAAAARARAGARRAAAAELLSLASLLVAAAERRVEVAVTTLGGQRTQLVPVVVGPDVVAGARPGAPTDVIPLASVALLDVDRGIGTDPDAEVDGPTLHDLLTAVADERPPVAVWTIDGAGPATGDLSVVGDDVVVLTTAGSPGRRVVPLRAVARLRLAP